MMQQFGAGTANVQQRLPYAREAEINGDLLQLVLKQSGGQHNPRNKMRHAFMQTVRVMNSVAARHDPYTAHHQEQVAILALALGRQLGLSSNSLDGLYLGALVHDLGKVAIPGALLNKPSGLSPEEFALVKTHVQAGCELLQHVTLPWPIMGIIAQHHERLDGSGYPRGLAGDGIIEEARIVAVADVFQALCEDRPYRKALGIRAALAELEAGAGTKFDTEVVRAARVVTARLDGAGADLWERITMELGGARKRQGRGRSARGVRPSAGVAVMG